MTRAPLVPMLAGLGGNVPKLAAVRFLCWMHLMSAVIIPFFREWGRLSFVQIFALQTWFMLMSFLMEVPTGAVADRFGRRVSVALGAFLLAVASILYGTLPRLGVFVLAEAIFAVALALISGADEALAYDSLLARGREAEASRVMARLEAAKLAGILAGALLGAAVASGLGLRWPMLLQAVPMALSGLLALGLTEPPRAREGAAEGGGYLRLLSGGLHHLRSAPELRALAVDQVACATVAWLVIWLYQLQLARIGVPLAAYGVVHAAMGLGQITLLSRIAGVERAVGGWARLARLTALVPPLAMLGLAATTGVPPSILLIVAAATAGLGRPPLFSGPVNRLIPSERRATVLSAVSAARTLAVAMVYPAVGAILDRSLVAALVFVGVLGLAAAALARAPGRLFEERAPGTRDQAAGNA
ncbi:MAG TPA: MFS transporter [Vicinamibacteria bacterium]|nr:MFS transporter [Vicinamibacteria bacterium]